MGRIIMLEDFKRQRSADRAFRLWRRFFPEQPSWNARTAWQDVADGVLLAFGSETPEAQKAMEDMIMVCLGLGHGGDFQAQALDTLCRLLNGYFYLIDQARFEIMARVDWVDRPAGARKPILDLARDPSTYEPAAMAEIPAPRPAHPGYDEDCHGKGMERAVLVRKAIPEAIRRMRSRLERPTGR